MSSLPVFDGERLKPRHAVLRSFLVAEEHGYMVMPGGLTRVGAVDDQLIVTSQAGGISKDTWVLATEPEKQASLLSERPQAPYVPERDGAVPGRVADNMFWTGRYAERAEFLSRLLRLTLLRKSARLHANEPHVITAGRQAHGEQVLEGDSSEGMHASLLYNMSTAVQDFYTDLNNLGLEVGHLR